jgi:adenosylcobinamide-phosphate synthase
VCFVIGQNVIKGFAALKNDSRLTCSRYFLLNLQGAALGIELGGPVYYSDNKSRLAKCGGPRSIVLDDINRAIHGLQKARWVFLTLCFIVSLMLSIGK